MKHQPVNKTQASKRQIIGVSLPPKTAAAFKQEASRRGLTIKALFQEMWSLYKEQRKDGR